MRIMDVSRHLYSSVLRGGKSVAANSLITENNHLINDTRACFINVYYVPLYLWHCATQMPIVLTEVIFLKMFRPSRNSVPPSILFLQKFCECTSSVPPHILPLQKFYHASHSVSVTLEVLSIQKFCLYRCSFHPENMSLRS